MEALGLDRICVIIGRTRHKMVLAELQEAAKRGAKLIELRLDFLAKAVDFRRLLPFRNCPWICTLRRREDGGRWTGTEVERQTILRQAIVAGFDWVDLESDIADSIRRFGNVKRIVSYHNCQETPDNLNEIYEKMCQQDADIVKIAVTAKHPEDNLKTIELVRHAKKPTIAHCMGEMGIPSRFLSIKFGAPFMYAAFNKERGISPGLFSFDELKKYYAIDRIDSSTSVYGVAGDPVGHSLSPALHNQLFKHYGVNSMYLPFHIPRGEFNHTVRKWLTIPIEGYSVTIPHKEDAAQISNEADEVVKRTGVANTLIRHKNGYAASNTDYPGVRKCFEGPKPSMDDGTVREWNVCQALVLGAGGIAKIVVQTLSEMGVYVIVSSKTLDRADKLAKSVHGKAVDWPQRHRSNCDIVVNCTPIGMHPNVDESPIHASYLRPGMVVFDTVYNPQSTLLIKEANLRGCRVILGTELFIQQAALQFQAFTKIEPDLNLLRDIIRQAISPLAVQIQSEVINQQPYLSSSQNYTPNHKHTKENKSKKGPKTDDTE